MFVFFYTGLVVFGYYPVVSNDNETIFSVFFCHCRTDFGHHCS